MTQFWNNLQMKDWKAKTPNLPTDLQTHPTNDACLYTLERDKHYCYDNFINIMYVNF